ncbi:MAG: HAMP domain-containing histidine kinase [Oligoflexia bacterium]|nr:HAMP domain-containing histidine kinase [Oligoflexia bacterium]
MKETHSVDLLLGIVQRLSLARDLQTIVDLVRHGARELTGADGATFILKEQDQCYYVDEDAIGPLWKGRRFPLEACVSGWTMLHHRSALIEDIYDDPRVPTEAYRPTFVKSLVMVPIRTEAPIGAIGTYWARRFRASPRQVKLLQALADSTSIALENLTLYSDLSRSLAETRSARDELARQLHLRDEFISICAHELKTPLTPLTLQIQFLHRLLLSGPPAGAPQEDAVKSGIRKFLAISNRQISDFSKLIDNLLDASRINLGHFNFSLQNDVNLSAIIRKVIAEYQAAGFNELKASISENLRGRWDPLRLEQAMRNLISNAVKYGEKKPIEISAAPDRDGQVRVIVKDHGFGIAKEDQERIFNRFERAASMRRYGGVGLGLYITREIVQGLGGTIHVESERNQGAAFVMRLPVRPPIATHGAA